MKKKQKRASTEAEEKQVDQFIDRLLDILMMQVEQEALAKQDLESKVVTSTDKD